MLAKTPVEKGGRKVNISHLHFCVLFFVVFFSFLSQSQKGDALLFQFNLSFGLMNSNALQESFCCVSRPCSSAREV